MHELSQATRAGIAEAPRDTTRHLVWEALSMGLFDITDSARMFEHLIDSIETHELR
ncbi:hypothetical protein Ga0609869_001014 [Rhodovulum iodosum]|uniref:Uncharacterized protein n=1 Tax=Rhodovulum iodosum TaxID=68291 RepID=A0ABV3XQQ1_9RHOB|nr:hypothetical protein [Rhodovulum robiginosum]